MHSFHSGSERTRNQVRILNLFPMTSWPSARSIAVVVVQIVCNRPPDHHVKSHNGASIIKLILSYPCGAIRSVFVAGVGQRGNADLLNQVWWLLTGMTGHISDEAYMPFNIQRPLTKHCHITY